MTKEERIKLYAALSAPFPDEAIERTEGAVTGRGYDTTGLKYQYVVDRLNEVLGVGGFRTDRTITVKAITTAKGRAAYEAIAEIRVELGEWIDGEFVAIAQAWGDGGHTAMTEADARKGAFTNGFKKAVAFLGPGREAYRGTIDDDHVPADMAVTPPQTSRAPEAPPALRTPAAVVPVARDRLTSKQHSTLRSLSRTTGYDDRGFRDHVRQRYGADPAYLSVGQASELIGELIAQANGARKAG